MAVTRLGLYGGPRESYSGFVAPAPAGLNYYRVTRTLPTSGAVDVVSGIGFTPTCCRVWVGVAAAEDTAYTHSYAGVGFSDGTNQWACGFGDDDNVSPPDAWSHQSDDAVIYYGNNTVSAQCSAVGGGNGPGVGKWTFAWSDFPSDAWYAIYEFWDCDAHVGTVNLGTGTSAVDCTTTGVDPNVVFVAGTGSSNSTTNTTQQEGVLTYGVASNTSGSVIERGIGYASKDGGDGSASVINFVGWDDAIAGRVLNDSTDYKLTTTLGLTGKFQLTPSASASSQYIGWLALDVGSNKTFVGTVSMPNDTSLWDVNDVGFEAGQVDLFGGLIGSGDVGTLQTSGETAEVFWMANTDGSTASGLSWASEDDDTSITDAENAAASGWVFVLDSGGGTQYDIPDPTLDSGGWTVTPTTADPTSHVAFVFALETGEGTGGEAGAGFVGIVRPMITHLTR